MPAYYNRPKKSNPIPEGYLCAGDGVCRPEKQHVLWEHLHVPKSGGTSLSFGLTNMLCGPTMGEMPDGLEPWEVTGVVAREPRRTLLNELQHVDCRTLHTCLCHSPMILLDYPGTGHARVCQYHP